MRIVWTIIILAAALLLSGCTRSLTYKVIATSCLNPVDMECRDVEADSRPLLLRMYPLNACPVASDFKWADFLEEELPDSVADFKEGGRQELIIERDTKAVINLERYSRKVQCFLLVAIGRFEGTSSIVVFEPSRFQKRATLKLSGYNIYVLNTEEEALEQ